MGERKRHYEMSARAKIERTDGMKTVLCHKCNMPRGIGRIVGDRVLSCRNCNAPYLVSPAYATLRALERINWNDNIGPHECWKLCPSCGIMVSKGHGCDHVHCGHCKHDFTWSEAKVL